MKTIFDAEWKLTEYPKGVLAIVELDNNTEISIAMNKNTYGGNAGMFEICVFKTGTAESIEMKCLDGGTVAGWLDLKAVNDKIQEIQEEFELE